VSSILQYLSFETLESMLYQMKSLNLSKFKQEFLMLTVFHAHQFNMRIDQLAIEGELKASLSQLVTSFLGDLLKMAEIDITEITEKESFRTMASKVASYQHS
jgi:hypothetical protein